MKRQCILSQLRQKRHPRETLLSPEIHRTKVRKTKVSLKEIEGTKESHMKAKTPGDWL
jgi:hypothetical protein